MGLLENGIYHTPNLSGFFFRINGEKVEVCSTLILDFPDLEPEDPNGTVAFGDFGPAKNEIFEISDKHTENYNLDINCFYGMTKSKGIVDKSGKAFHINGVWNCADTFKWMSPEDLKSFAEDREPLETPSCPYYKIQPENQGKLVWLSGPPGAGKSTTGAMMARHTDFVYYEADCIANFLNPFVDPNSDNPTMSAMTQKPLKGVPRDILDSVQQGQKVFEPMMKGEFDNLDWEAAKPFYKIMAEDISRQKKRIGGNFVIAHAVTSRMMRDYIRETIPECIFVTLTLTKEGQLARVKKRHGDDSEEILKFLLGIYDLYEGPAEDEKNTFNVDITEDMTPKDVMEKVVDLLN